MALLVYMTAASADEAESIAGDLVETACGLREHHGPDPLGILVEGESFAVRRSPSSPRRTTIVLKRWPPGACLAQL